MVCCCCCGLVCSCGLTCGLICGLTPYLPRDCGWTCGCGFNAPIGGGSDDTSDGVTVRGVRRAVGAASSAGGSVGC